MTCRGHQSYVVDHTLLSPSGRVSKAALRAVKAREAERMAACAARDEAARLACPDCQRGAQREALERVSAAACQRRAQAAELRRLADLGMRPKAHRALAAKLEAEADILSAR